MNNIELHKFSVIALDDITNNATGHQLLHTPEFTYLIGNNEICVVNNGNPSESVSLKSSLLNAHTHLDWFNNDLIVLGNNTHLVFVDRKELHLSFLDIVHVAATWTSNHKYCCIVKNDGTLDVFAFTEDASVIGRMGTNNIYSATAPKHEIINLGWGSQETQFKGKAKKSVEIEDKLNYILDKSLPTIACDAKDNFIVNFYSEEHNGRTFKIFNYQGVLQYTGPMVNGMQGEMAWKLPSSVIFVVVSKKDCKEIQAYEKIGAFREKFQILDDKPVKRIEWSDDGTLLIVYQTDTDGSALSIYMLQQGAWCLKQYLEFTSSNNLIDYHLLKSQNNIYSIAVKTTSTICIYSFKLAVNVISLSDEPITTSAVTKDKTLEITVLSESISPPTMASCNIKIKNPISIVKFNPFIKEVAVLDSKCNLYIFDYATNTYSLKQTLTLTENIGESSILFHMYYVNTHTVELIYYSDLKTISILTINLLKSPVDKNEYTNKKCAFGTTYRERVCNSDSLIHLQFNRLYVVSKKKYQLLREYPFSPVQIESIKLNNTLFTFSLLETGYFLADDYLISKYASSFVVHGNYVHYTDALRNEIISFHLKTEALHATFVQSQKSCPLGGRPVEKGALIVTGITISPNVILQLPRGNLETIKLTLILFRVIDDLLSQGKWTAAYDLIRMQKINSNILVDLDFNRFTCNISNFIKSLETAKDLNQFIEELSDDIEMRDLHIKHAPDKHFHRHPKKKVELCERILETIEQSSSLPTHITSAVLACLVCKKPVFKIIHKLFCVEHHNEEAIQGIRQSIKCLVDKGLTHMSIFKMSLATFNIRLTRLVADALNMDPQQYVEFLNNLETMNNIDIRYAISDYLQNYDEAFSYLIRTNVSSDKMLSYIREKEIFNVAWRILKPKGNLLELIVKEYAEKCAGGKTKTKLLEASIIYQNIGDYKLAYCCAKRAGLWRRCCSLINKVIDIDVECEKKEIALGLVERNNFLEASKIYVQLKMCEKAYELLFRNGFYRQAYEVARIDTALNKSSSLLIPKLDQCVFKKMQKLRSAEEEFDKLQKRLFSVWEEKELAVDLLGNLQEFDEASSLYADSSLASTNSSRHTKTTARQRRKQERKITSARPGSKYEDLGLLRALHSKITEITELRNDTQNFVYMYLSVDPQNMQPCGFLITTVNMLIRKIQNLLPKIWLKEFKRLDFHSSQSKIIAARANIALLPLQFRVAPENVREIPLDSMFLANRPKYSSELHNKFLHQQNRLINDELTDDFI